MTKIELIYLINITEIIFNQSRKKNHKRHYFIKGVKLIIDIMNYYL